MKIWNQKDLQYNNKKSESNSPLPLHIHKHTSPCIYMYSVIDFIRLSDKLIAFTNRYTVLFISLTLTHCCVGRQSKNK